MSKPVMYVLGPDGRTPEPFDTSEYETDEGRARLAFSEKNRQVGRTHVDDVLVSTVFLGVDHAWDGGEPVLFETMTFSDTTRAWDSYQERYHTWDEAVEGHRRIVERVKASITNRSLGAKLLSRFKARWN